MILRTGRKFSSTFVDQNFKVGLYHMRQNYLLMSVDYFTKVLEDDLKAVVKPQYVDQIPKAVKGPEKSVEVLLKARAQMGNLEEILDVLGQLSRTFHRLV